MVAVATITTFSAFKVSGVNTGKLFSPTLYFHGDPTIASEVEDESLWTTTPNGENCNNTQEAACSLEVDASDLNGNTLDAMKVQIKANKVGSGFIPSEEPSSNATQFNPINRTL